MRRALLPCLLPIALAAVPSTGHAQARDPAAAEVLFQQARDALKRGDYASACPKFAESQRLDPGIGTLVNLAQCEEKQGRLATAWQHYREAADQAEAGDKRGEIARKGAAAIEKRVPRLTIRLAPGAPEGTKVTRDGVELGAASLGTALPVDPGNHVIVVTALGRENVRTEVTISEGQVKDLALEPGRAQAPSLDTAAAPAPAAANPGKGMPAETSTRSAPSSTWRTVGYSVGAAGIVGVGVGILFWSLKESEFSAAQNAADNKAASQQRDQQEKYQTEIDQHNRDGDRDRNIAYLSFALGGVAVATGLALVLLAPHTPADRSKARAQLSPQLLSRGYGLSLHGDW